MLFLCAFKNLAQHDRRIRINCEFERIDTSIDEYFFRVILVLESGDNLPLTPNYTSNYINGDSIVRVTKDFLELKHKDSAR